MKKPFFVLAPMDDVTDVVFRQVVGQTARPDVFFTEFTNVEGLQSKGREQVMRRLLISPDDHPIVAQIWGLNPENFYQSAQLIKELGFDGIDINMGCPEKGVVQRGACSGLIHHPALAKEIVEATKKGAGGLPVSVKTRLGVRSLEEMDEWIPFLLKMDLAALTVHLRTSKEMSKVPAHWDLMEKVVQYRNKIARQTLIVGNGDVINRQDGMEKAEKYQADGVMIGRGIFDDPWAFGEESADREWKVEDRIKLLLFHARLFTNTWGESKDFNILKKFFKIYISGFEGAAALRGQLMECQNLEQVEKLVVTFEK